MNIDELVASESAKFAHSSKAMREAEKARTEIFNFSFNYLITHKDTSDNTEKEAEVSEVGIRKGRVIAIKKLQAAKQKVEAKKHDKEDVEVRILSLLGKLGGKN